MKRTMLIIMMLYPLYLIAQKKDINELNVPAEVRKVFLERFTDAKNKFWKTKNGAYEVDFNLNSNKFEAKFDGDGTWKKTTKNISRSAVPELVINKWKASEYGKWILDKTQQVSTPDYKDLYLLRLIKGRTELEILYDDKGEIMKMKEKI